MHKKKNENRPSSRLSEMDDSKPSTPPSRLYLANPEQKQTSSEIGRPLNQHQATRNGSQIKQNDPKIFTKPRNQQSNEELILQTLNIFRKIKQVDKHSKKNQKNKADLQSSTSSQSYESYAEQEEIEGEHCIWDDSQLMLNGYFNLDELNTFQLYKLRLLTFPSFRQHALINSKILKNFFDLQKSSYEMNMQRKNKKTNLKIDLETQIYSLTESIKEHQNDQIIIYSDISQTETFKQFQNHLKKYADSEFKQRKPQKYKRYDFKHKNPSNTTKKGKDSIKEKFLQMLNEQPENFPPNNIKNKEPNSPLVSLNLQNETYKENNGSTATVNNNNNNNNHCIFSRNSRKQSQVEIGNMSANFVKNFQIKRMTSPRNLSLLNCFQLGQSQIKQTQDLSQLNQIQTSQGSEIQRRISSSDLLSLSRMKQTSSSSTTQKTETILNDLDQEFQKQEQQTSGKRSRSNYSQDSSLSLPICEKNLSLVEIRIDSQAISQIPQAKQKVIKLDTELAIKQSLDNAIQQKLILNKSIPFSSNTQNDLVNNYSSLKKNSLSCLRIKTTSNQSELSSSSSSSSSKFLPKISVLNLENNNSQKQPPFLQNFAQSTKSQVNGNRKNPHFYSNTNKMINLNNDINNFPNSATSIILNMRSDSLNNERNPYPSSPIIIPLKSHDKSSFLSLERKKSRM